MIKLGELNEIKAYAEKLKFDKFYSESAKRGILTARKIHSSVCTVPVDPLKYYAMLKIPVIELDFSFFKNPHAQVFDGLTIYRDSLSELIPENYYASFIKKYNGAKYIVVVEKKLPVTRKRFVLAHELGHICLKHFEMREKFKKHTTHRLVTASSHDLLREVILLNIQKNRIKAKSEIEANAFAGELLVPIVLLKNALFNLGINKLKDLASVFQVSTSVVYIQAFLNNLENYLILEP